MLGRTLGTRLGHLSVVGSLGLALWLALGCQPIRPHFRGTDGLPVTLRPGDSAHVTLVATRAAVDQADNGLRLEVTTVSRGLPAGLSVVPDDASLDELFTAYGGNVSAADLSRICPATGECLVGVTLYQGEGEGDYRIRFGVESYGSFSREAVAAAELD